MTTISSDSISVLLVLSYVADKSSQAFIIALRLCVHTISRGSLWSQDSFLHYLKERDNDRCVLYKQGCGNKFYISTTATTLVHLSHRPRQSPIFSSDSLTLLYSPIVESTSSNKFNTNIGFSRKQRLDSFQQTVPGLYPSGPKMRSPSSWKGGRPALTPFLASQISCNYAQNAKKRNNAI